ncbi:X-Pro dipeptidase [Suhomyces tanzawaensis NRRL Y-17324]|uniref:X-Pro dipeptidase n=1 Tax=Suhomyces tanzawaensis NRRL Y-17324 TaxID=984487 RepID=A0A1E4SCE6_9ASCO|nr:X-Pro dipeptidase [Suhomyces tanzawaensis NRRL Y-17324]ODV77163.1 X-Pro dipeptidase [Suhomyces tanzawaensis NRRL Y-17324]
MDIIKVLHIPNHSGSTPAMTTGPASLIGKKYPAKQHARNVQAHLAQKLGPKGQDASFFMSGEDLVYHQYCDQTKPMRQNRYFYYLSGVDIPGSHVLFLGKKDHLTIYLPNIDYEDVMWSGMPLSLEEAAKKFDADEVKYVSDLEADLKAVGSEILTTDINDFNKKFSTFLSEGNKDFFYALDESRLIKDEYEIELMREAARITDNCHLAVMSAIPIETNETHIHAEFTYHALRQGSKHHAYDPICCSGPSCSTLHYVKNDDEIEPTKKSILIDAGAEWSCYAADVTRCFPINGDWTKEHLEIYNAVLKMQQVTMAMIKPGASWDDIHLQAHKVLIEEFLKLGIFKSEFSAQELFDSKVSARFFPHGLGHLLGMDTHDVGGYPNYEDPDPLLQYLRLRRPLLKGMVLTDEPGIYFSPFLLEDTLKDETKVKYINKDVLDKYWYIGGVRIEDDLLITEDGFENLTGITSDPVEISKIIKAGLDKGAQGFHNVV